MRTFAAIDFETANHNFSSVCSVGIVIVCDGIITDKIYSLIRPEPEWYAYWHTKIHGITLEDTMNKKVFPFVWKEIAPKIEGLPLVAHNSLFDSDCLKAVHKVYQMDYPNYKFFCTCNAARKVFKGLLPNHKLPTVAAYCGYNLTQHHHALADAEACATIALQVF